MDESYLDRIRKEVGDLKAECSTLEGYRNRLQKEINQLKNERELGKRDVDAFIDSESKRITEQLGEINKRFKGDIENNKRYIKELNRRGREVVESEKEISAEMESIREREKVVDERVKKLEDERSVVVGLMDLAQLRAEQAARNKLQSKGLLEKAKMAYMEAVMKQEEIMKYVEDKKAIIAEKEEIMNKQFKIAQVKEEMMENGLKNIADREIRWKEGMAMLEGTIKALKQQGIIINI